MATFNHNKAAPIMSPRLGTLAIPGRTLIQTPQYIPLTTRGAVPHLTHDVLRDHSSISSLYLGLEDFIEKQPKNAPPPIYKVPLNINSSTTRNGTQTQQSRLRTFISAPPATTLILGPRRIPPIPCPPTNTPDAIAILTSVGHRHLDGAEYTDAIQKLRPDIAVGLADLVVGPQAPGVKRKMKMVDRTHAFTMEATEVLYGAAAAELEEKEEEEGKGKGEGNRCKTAYFAPILPLENTQQQLYLEELADEDALRPFISGLALYEAASLSIVPESLGELPRLLFSEPNTPQDILHEVSLGADILTIPFLGAASDAGMALDFTFPAPSPSPTSSSSTDNSTTQPLALALNLWSPIYATDTTPLGESCPCYTCTKHHRAYIHHLLSAKEMLAWTLLQIHNHHTVDAFFAAVRESIRHGTFEQDIRIFEQSYASQFPEKTGEGPRLRGYHLPPSAAYQPKHNTRKWGRLDDKAEKYAESLTSSVATPDGGEEAGDLERSGFAERAG